MSPVTVASYTPTAAPTSGAAAVLAYARAQLGKPYVWGATGPDSFDCSGLVQSAYKAAGISVPRTTATLIGVGTAVAKADLQPGDLVFPNTGHVQIYSGAGNVVEAARKGVPVREVPMWGFLTARRVLDGSDTSGLVTGAVGAVLDGVKGVAAAVPGVSEVATLASSLNPAKWGEEFQKIGLRLVVVGAGLGLVVLGASRLVAGGAQNLYNDAKELL